MPSELPPLYALQAFVTAAELGSFTRAATALHLTQSAISRQIQLLEAFYGCPLFVRQAKGLVLSTEGTQLLPAVQEAFKTLKQATATVAQARGVLTLQLPPTFAARWFLPRLPALRRALPDLEVRIATHWSDAPDFSHSGVDAIVAHGLGGWPQLTEVLLMQEQLTPLCAPALLPRLKRIRDLAKFPRLHPDPRLREWALWLRAVGSDVPETVPGQVFDTLDMALSAALRGQGVAIADPALLRESLDDGVLAMPFGQQVPSGMAYFLTYPAHRAEQRKLQAFQAWLLGQIASVPVR